MHLGLLLLLGCRPSPDDSGTAPAAAFGDELARLALPPAGAVWVDGARAFVCAGDSGVVVVHVADAAALAEEALVGVPCRGLAGEGGRIWIAAGAQGLVALHPGNLAILGGYAAGFPITALAIDGGEAQAWIAGTQGEGEGGQAGPVGVQGVALWDVDHLEPNRTADLDPGEVLALGYDRAALALARADGTVELLGLALDPRARVATGPVAGTAGGGLRLVDHQLWVAAGEAGLLHWDTSDPADPQARPGWTTEPAWGLALVDARVYVGTTEALVLLDAAADGTLTERGRVALPGLTRPEGLYVLGDQAWVADAAVGGLVAVHVGLDGA